MKIRCQKRRAANARSIAAKVAKELETKAGPGLRRRPGSSKVSQTTNAGANLKSKLMDKKESFDITSS